MKSFHGCFCNCVTKLKPQGWKHKRDPQQFEMNVLIKTNPSSLFFTVASWNPVTHFTLARSSSLDLYCYSTLSSSLWSCAHWPVPARASTLPQTGESGRRHCDASRTPWLSRSSLVWPGSSDSCLSSRQPTLSSRSSSASSIPSRG